MHYGVSLLYFGCLLEDGPPKNSTEGLAGSVRFHSMRLKMEMALNALNLNLNLKFVFWTYQATEVSWNHDIQT